MYEAETIQQLQDIEKAIREGNSGMPEAFEGIKESIKSLAGKLQDQMDQDADWRKEDKEADVPDTSEPYEKIEARLDTISEQLKAILNKMPTAGSILAAIIIAGCLSTTKQWATNEKPDDDGDIQKMLKNVDYYLGKIRIK